MVKEERGPELAIPRGNLLAGVLGALLGTLLGAVPYGAMLLYLRPAMEDRALWEALGLVAGYCGCLGYRGLRGHRSTAAAFVIVGITAWLALAAANLAAELYTLGSWPLEAEQIRMAIRVLILPERRMSLLVGAVCGLLGIWSARSYLLWYTNPALAVRKYGEWALKVPAGTIPPPRTFVVRSKSRWPGLEGWACALVFAVLMMLSLVGFDPVEERGWLLFSMCLCEPAVIGSVYAALRSRNCRLEVDGTYVRYTNAVGRTREFYVGDIYGVERSALTGYYQLFDREGWRLGWFDPALKNGALLIRYLREHGVGLGAETT